MGVNAASGQSAVGRRQSSKSTLPTSAYIHVPFCRHRCGYCNFTLVAGHDELISPFLAALETELSWLGEPRQVDTLFFGGGTPTHLRGEQLRRLLEIVLRWHPLAAGHEFSVEANPADLNLETIGILADFGVTRVSLGAQSFNLEKLRLLERDHQAEDIVRAAEVIRSRGLDVSLDLIFGVPGETLVILQNDLQSALRLSPDHISTYGLTFEQGTSFWTRLEHGRLARIDEEIEREMYSAAIDTLTIAGFEHYEVSNFARPGKRCRHNEIYWAGDEYYAAGPGAARHVGRVRESNFGSVTKWLASVQEGEPPIAERECLPPKEKARELLVFALRRLEGVDRTWFRNQTNLDLDEIAGKTLQKFVGAGLMADDGKRVQLSREGLYVSDSLWAKLLSGDR
jgi:oxygen-independent coproporphyrinogen-3 oxidase